MELDLPGEAAQEQEEAEAEWEERAPGPVPGGNVFAPVVEPRLPIRQEFPAIT